MVSIVLFYVLFVLIVLFHVLFVSIVLFYVLFCVDCVVLCTVCVQICTVLLPPGVNPTAVKYIISYQNIGNYQFFECDSVLWDLSHVCKFNGYKL